MEQIKASHSPGPWHVGGISGGGQLPIVYDANGNAVANAVVYHGLWSAETSEANAVLMAEAPTLLKAALEVLNRVELCGVDTGLGGPLSDLRDAVNRAQGNASASRREESAKGFPMTVDGRFLENIAAISADIHADDRLPAFLEKSNSDFFDRMRWVMEAGRALTETEPDDYEAAGLSWYETTEAIADGFYEDLDPEKAVKRALTTEAMKEAGGGI